MCAGSEEQVEYVINAGAFDDLIYIAMNDLKEIKE